MTTPYTVLTPRLKLCCPEPAMAAELAALVRQTWSTCTPGCPGRRRKCRNRSASTIGCAMCAPNSTWIESMATLIFDRSGTELLGSTGLHRRGPERSLEIGYWIDKFHTHQGLATETSAALTRAAFELLDVLRVEIHCDPANIASAAVPARLGYTNDGTLRLRLVNSDGELRDEMVWSLLLSEYPTSPSAIHPSKHTMQWAGDYCRREAMCRNIRTLRSEESPATEEEITAAALQYVRKVSGYRKPSRRNQAAFDQAVT